MTQLTTMTRKEVIVRMLENDTIMYQAPMDHAPGILFIRSITIDKRNPEKWSAKVWTLANGVFRVGEGHLDRFRQIIKSIDNSTNPA